MQGDAAVECRLPPEGEEDPLRALLLDDLLDEERRHGEEVDLIGYTLRRLYGSDIGVDEDGVYPLLTHGLQRLRARVVELPSLTYLECSRAEEQHLLYLVLVAHILGNRLVVVSCLEQLEELLEDEDRVGRPAAGLGVELG